jgi:midasin (ATPase involved in ribosome maturation)
MKQNRKNKQQEYKGYFESTKNEMGNEVKLNDMSAEAGVVEGDDDDEDDFNLPVHPSVCDIAGTLLLKQNIMKHAALAPSKLEKVLTVVPNSPRMNNNKRQAKQSKEVALSYDILGGLVMVPSARRNLSKLAKLVANGGNKPILLVGAPGSGKSLTFHALASACHRGSDASSSSSSSTSLGGGGGGEGGGQDNGGLLELHLDDSVDAKSLLGGYVCGEKPGQFVWQV